MPNSPTPPGGNGPWLLILDRDPADPKWILATVESQAVVQPADHGELFTGARLAGEWVRVLFGRPHATLTPMTRAHVWRIDEHPS
jgi:hypothetical protein